MRSALVLLFASPLLLVGTTARADVAPDPDPYMACLDQELGSSCYSDLGDGYCVEKDCPGEPGKKCGYCDPMGTATTTATGTGTTGTTGSTGETGGTTGGTAGVTGETAGSSSTTGGATSDGGTSDGTSPKKEEGCGCRSDASPGAALGLLGLVGLLRRRRR